MNPFETRFQQFIMRSPGCTVLDNGKPKGSGEVADFLLDNNRIVAELKCLEKDMLGELQELATKIIDDRSLPFYGKFPFSALAESQPDKRDLNNQAALAMIRPLERHFEKANSQIKSIKRRLALKNSWGLMIIANTSNPTLEPQIAAWLLSLLFSRKKQDGSPICSSIECMLYLTEVHEIGALDTIKIRPAITTLRSEDPQYKGLYDYVQHMLERWANFNGLPIFFAEKPFHEIADFSKTPMRRGGLPSHSCKGLKIAAKFRLPALCKRCGSRFPHPADNRG